MWTVCAGSKCAFDMRVNFSKKRQGIQIAAAVTVVVLFSGLSPVHSAGWWDDPCDTRPQVQVRHARSPATTQLHTSFIKIKDLQSQLKEIYPKYTLNKNQAQRYVNCINLKKLTRKMKKFNDTTKAGKEFYKSLKKVAIFLDKLKNKPIIHNSTIFDINKRLEYYKGMQHYIKNALCEIYHEHICDNPPKMPRNLTADMKCLDQELDLTKVQTLDYFFNNLTVRFLKQGRNHLMRIAKIQRNNKKHKCKSKPRKGQKTTT